MCLTLVGVASECLIEAGVTYVPVLSKGGVVYTVVSMGAWLLHSSPSEGGVTSVSCK